MRHFAWLLLAVSSLLPAGLAHGATRPQYGGTLHVAMRIAPASLDPADSTQPDSVARRNLLRLLFDTLVIVDDFGRVRPALAVSWQAAPGNQRWQFRLRQGVTFDDGSQLTPGVVAASLRAVNQEWSVYALEDSVAIEVNTPDPLLLARLAQPRNSIAKRTANGISGTGPFHVTDWRPGDRLVAAANEDYWAGRPFLDAVEFQFGKMSRDQLVALELGRADVAEVGAEQARRLQAEGRRISISEPVELMALVFSRDPQSNAEAQMRDALALSVDRASIRNVLLQGEGEPSGGILPNWMTGYGFLFPADNDLQKARQKQAEVRQNSSWTLGYDAWDPLARLVAERISLNARDAGISLQLMTTGNPDVRLVRVSLPTVDSRLALAYLASSFGLPAPKAANFAESLFQAESTALQTRRVLPLFYLPVNYGLSVAVKNWSQHRDAGWDLKNVWLSAGKP
jgi:peptide/nickel transport system substrate-binding protein